MPLLLSLCLLAECKPTSFMASHQFQLVFTNINLHQHPLILVVTSQRHPSKESGKQWTIDFRCIKPKITEKRIRMGDRQWLQHRGESAIVSTDHLGWHGPQPHKWKPVQLVKVYIRFYRNIERRMPQLTNLILFIGCYKDRALVLNILRLTSESVKKFSSQ